MQIRPFDAFHQTLLSAVGTGQARLSFSQFGEDTLIWHWLGNRRGGFYLDVGCHHPYRYSNTALLSLFGDWTGVNVDPDIRAIELFREHRPKDVNVHAAVGREEGRLDVFVFKDGAVNTLDPDMAHKQRQHYGEPVIASVDVLPLSEIVARHVPNDRDVDFLNVDAEGLDLDVLKSNDWRRCRPAAVCVEAHEFRIDAPQESETFQFMKSLGYRLRAHYYATSIYDRAD